MRFALGFLGVCLLTLTSAETILCPPRGFELMVCMDSLAAVVEEQMPTRHPEYQANPHGVCSAMLEKYDPQLTALEHICENLLPFLRTPSRSPRANETSNSFHSKPPRSFVPQETGLCPSDIAAPKFPSADGAYQSATSPLTSH